jgi:hypothetical protein
MWKTQSSMWSLVFLVKALPFLKIRSHLFAFCGLHYAASLISSPCILWLCSSDKIVFDTTDFIVSAMQSPKYCFIILGLWCCSLRIMSYYYASNPASILLLYSAFLSLKLHSPTSSALLSPPLRPSGLVGQRGIKD